MRWALLIAMGRLKERMARFMYGRYGMDQLSRMINYISFALLILTLLTNSTLIYLLALAGIIRAGLVSSVRSAELNLQESPKSDKITLGKAVESSFSSVFFRIAV